MPNGRQILKDAGFHTVVIGARDDVVRDVRSTLYLLWGGVAFVLLIGCVNIANLVLARAYRRSGELATRMALGAERGRLARQILSEAAVTAVLGGMLGLGVGALGLKLVGSLGMQSLPRGSDVSLDGTVVLFTLGLSLAAAVLFGALPVAHVFRSDLGGVFRSESRTGTASRRAMLLRGLLVTGQVALAFVLLSGAGLLFRSFQAASRVDPGFQPDGVLTGVVTLSTARYPDGASRRRFASELLDRIRALPGVESAGATSMIPFGGNNSSSVIWPEGYTPRPGESLIAPYASFVAPDYFEAMGIPVREGRAFDDRDGPDAPNSIVIDELLARRYWPDSSPLGHKMVWGTTPNGDAQVPDSSLYTIVGVVGAIQQNDLTATGQVGAYYFPYLHRAPNSGMMLVVKTSGDATASTPAVRSALSDLDPELPLFDVESMGARIEDSLRARRSSMVLLSIFSGVALFLAVVGLYGVLAHAVAQRTREIGIRMAMGGAPSDVFRMVVVQGARVVLVGLLLGVGGSFALVRVVRSVLFGVGPSDPTVLVVSAAALAVVGLVACVIPALRATRVDPTEALAGG